MDTRTMVSQVCERNVAGICRLQPETTLQTVITNLTLDLTMQAKDYTGTTIETPFDSWEARKGSVRPRKQCYNSDHFDVKGVQGVKLRL